MEIGLFDSAVLAAGTAAGAVGALGLRALPDGALAVGRVAVVIPARDEAQRLPHLLAALDADPSLAAAGVTVLVVDDGSTDETAALARSWGVDVLQLDGPPAGWTGKAWACWRGVGEVAADVLVHLDADTVPEPGFVLRLAGAAEASDGLVSVQPVHRTVRAYEALSAPCNLVAAIAAGTGVADGPRCWRRPMAFGPAMAIPTRRYREVGGHSAVRAEVVEDLALATACASTGVPVETWCGGGISYRMYPEGLLSLVQGWTKNLSVGASSTPPLRLAAVACWVTATAMAASLPFRGHAGIVAFVFVALVSTALFRAVGRFPWWAGVAAPLLAWWFVGLVGWSSARRLLGRPSSWRGRAVGAS